MESKGLSLSVLPGKFAVCRLEADAAEPTWANKGDFVSITRTPDELSVVCPEISAPDNITAERNWRCLKIEGTLDFGLTGILASIATPLAEVRISIFALSTFNTDYVLVKDATLEAAIAALRKAGHTVQK